MPKIPVIKAKIFLRFLTKYGCEEVSIRGSHHKIFNPETNRTSVVAVHGSEDLDKGSFSGILNQLEIDVNDFLKFIEKN